MNSENRHSFEKVGVVGLGAIGMLYGSAMMDAGVDVRVLVDRERLDRYTRHPARVNGREVRFRYCTPEQGEPLDLILYATKASGLDAAMEVSAPFVGEETLLLSLLNGITSEEVLEGRFGKERVIYSVAQGMDAVREGRELRCTHSGQVILGEREPGAVSPRCRELAAWLTAHGVSAQAVPDMRRRQWGKLMLNVGVNQTVMVFEGTYGTVQVPGRPREVFIEAMREVQRLSALEGYPLSEEDLKGYIAINDSLDPEGAPSMRQDGKAHRPSEVELFAGTVIRLAKRHGLPASVNQWLYDRVREMEAAY